jgi:hypothetical protein
MSDVEAAAERYRRYKAGETMPYEKRGEPSAIDLDRLQRDRRCLADAFLAQRSALTALVAAVTDGIRLGHGMPNEPAIRAALAAVREG